jgi:uncharacterized protein involved in exopolysaccharide biosynthesis
MSSSEVSFSLRSVPTLIRRHKGKMILFALLVLGATVAWTAFGPRTYRSEAKLLVRLGRENTTVDATATMGQSPVVAVPMARENEINSILEELTSRDLIEHVVDSVGPDAILKTVPPEPAPGATAPAQPTTSLPPTTASGGEPDFPPTIDARYRAILALTKALKVEAVKRSNILVVSCEASRPDTAQAIVSRLVDFSLDRHMAVNRTPGAYRLLVQQAAHLDTRVRQTEEELRTLKSRTGLVSPESQRQILATRIGRLDDELLQATANLDSTQAEVTALEKQLARLPRTHVTATTRGVPNNAADLMRGQFYTLQLKELDLLARHPENHPEVKLIRRQSAAAKEILKREETTREQVTTGPSRTYEDLHQTLVRQQTQLVALKKRKEVLEEQLQHERAELKTFLADELQIARLQRRLAIEDSTQRKYAENLEQGRIDQALQSERISNISLVQSATLEAKPVRPRWSINLGFGLLLAVAGSLALAFLVESRRQPAAPADQAATAPAMNLPPDSSLRPLADSPVLSGVS